MKKILILTIFISILIFSFNINKVYAADVVPQLVQSKADEYYNYVIVKCNRTNVYGIYASDSPISYFSVNTMNDNLNNLVSGLTCDTQFTTILFDENNQIKNINTHSAGSYCSISSYAGSNNYLLKSINNIFKSDLKTIFFAKNAYIKPPTYPVEEFLKIVSLPNGFVQSGSYTNWTLRVGYQLKSTDSFNISDWLIVPHSATIKGLKIVTNNHWLKQSIPYTYVQGEMVADYYVPFGEHDIYFTMTNKNTGQTLTSETFKYKNYEGFVDANNDGLDDRSGLDEEFGGVVPDWSLGDIGNDIKFEMPDLTTVLSTLKSFLQIFVEPINVLFRGIPEIYMLIMFGLAIALVKFALGR